MAGTTPGQLLTAHWGVPDPAAVGGSEAGVERALRDPFFILDRRISLFLAFHSRPSIAWPLSASSARLRVGLPAQVSALSDHEQRNSNARMKCVKKKVLVIDIVDVALIAKQPICWPGIEKDERVPCKNELGLIWNNCGRRDHAINGKSMLPAEVSSEFRIWNVRALARWADLPLLGQLAMLLLRRFGLLLL